VVDLKTFLIWLQICLTNTVLMSQSKCQAVFGVIFLGHDIPNLHDPYIQYNTVLYDSTILAI